ncbi:MAG: hypothetical protein KO318_04955 [Methanobacterium sp.]|jgi:hypothetical protein|uniref:hypothetical protein n=1 Tax=Methanobacterium sp. TaxID=2164 RepID=UPI002584868B|nr:hypothetical protein [Methanobacterium sp.]MCC7559763.1 hypothetical protein [Methanobacterium sp.]
MSLKRYYVPPSEDEIENAFEQARLFIEEKGPSNILFFTPTKDIAETDLEMFLKGLFGSSTVKSLFKNPIRLSDGTIIRLESIKTFKKAMAKDSIVIGFYAGKKMLDLLNDSLNASAIIIVPGIMDKDVEDWIDIWNPEIFGGRKRTSKKLIKSCVVEKALETLTMLHSHSNHELGNNQDKAQAAELFHRLISAGEDYDPISIRKWAIKNGWSSKGADRLEYIAKSIIERKRIRKNAMSWRADLIKQFQDECNNQKT